MIDQIIIALAALALLVFTIYTVFLAWYWWGWRPVPRWLLVLDEWHASRKERSK